MFSCTPSVFLAEGAEVVQLMTVYHRGTPKNDQQPQEEGGEYD